MLLSCSYCRPSTRSGSMQGNVSYRYLRKCVRIHIYYSSINKYILMAKSEQTWTDSIGGLKCNIHIINSWLTINLQLKRSRAQNYSLTYFLCCRCCCRRTAAAFIVGWHKWTHCMWILIERCVVVSPCSYSYWQMYGCTRCSVAWLLFLRYLLCFCAFLENTLILQ